MEQKQFQQQDETTVESFPSVNENRGSIYQEVVHWNETHPLSPIPRLTYKLLRLLIKTGPFWILQLIRFILFVILLMPAWYHLVTYYFMSRQVRLNIRYGPNPRNYLDLFLPDKVMSGKKCPVVVFITGGVWLIGYKAWGTAIGRLLAQFGIVTVSVDYRNFPQGKMTDQLDDVDLAIDWTIRRIWKYGGDNKNIYLVGHSAGAHLTSYVYSSKMLSELEIEPAIHVPSPSPVKTPSLTSSHFYQPDVTKWKSSQIKAFVGISGPYFLPSLVTNFHAQGLHRYLLYKIFSHSSLLSFYSPVSLYPESLPESFSAQKKKLSDLPYRFYFMHGREDASVPWRSSEEFHEKLQKLGFRSKMILYEQRTHTSLVIEDLMSEKIEDAVVVRHLVHLICDLSNYRTNTNWDHYFDQHATFDHVLDCRCHLLPGMKAQEVVKQISQVHDVGADQEDQNNNDDDVCHLHHLHYFPQKVSQVSRSSDYSSIGTEEGFSLKRSFQKDESEEDDMIVAQNNSPHMISPSLLSVATRVCPF